MEDTRKATFAGLLILVSIAAAVAIIIASTNTDQLFHETHEYVVGFTAGSDVQGLDDKSGVRILGVDVGNVELVEVVADDQGLPVVFVTFSLPDRYTLRQGAVITVQSQITGGARLNIEALGDGPELAAGEIIKGYTLTLADVMASLHTLMPTASKGLESFTNTSDSVGELVRDVHGRVDGIVARYNAVMHTAELALANARDILGDTKSDIRSSIANINDLTGSARRKFPAALDEAQALMAKAKDAIAKLDPILDDGQAVAAQARSIVNDNRAAIDQTFTNVRRASVDLKGGIAEIRRAPWRLLNEPDAKDQRNLNLYEAARQFANGAHDLQAAALSIQLATADPNTEPEKLEELRMELAREIDTLVEVRQKLWDRFER